MKNILISAPFGNYYKWYPFSDICTPILGTYTWKRRSGAIRRWWRVIRTVRYIRGIGWVNRLGLPNPGIRSCPRGLYDKVISIHGFNSAEWLDLVVEAKHDPIELNLSCPNVGCTDVRDVIPCVRYGLAHGTLIIAKLPPVKWYTLYRTLYDEGVYWFHCCNTLPCKRGGLSGSVLKPLSIDCIRMIRSHSQSQCTIIGGGGIIGEQDVREYMDAGANKVSIGSMLFNPLNWRSVNGFNHIIPN